MGKVASKTQKIKTNEKKTATERLKTKPLPIDLFVHPSPNKDILDVTKVEYTFKSQSVDSLKNGLTDNDFGRLVSIFGEKEVKQLYSIHKEINKLANELFKKYNLIYFTDKNRKYLFSYESPLFRRDFGELIPIEGLSAFKKFGLNALYHADEKGFTKL